MDSYLEPLEAPKKSPRDSSKRASDAVPKKSETPVLPRKDPTAKEVGVQPKRESVKPAAEVPALPKKDPGSDAKTSARDSTKVPSSAPTAVSANPATSVTVGAGARDSTSIGSPVVAPAKPSAIRDSAAVKPARSSLAAPATSASGRHSVPSTVASAAASGASGAAGPASMASPGRASGTVAATAAAVHAGEAGGASVHVTAKVDSVILTAAAPVLHKKKASRKPKQADNRRESFYASDRFRAREATERDETEELSNIRGARDVEEEFRVVPSEVFRALAELRDIAREANTEVLTPEFVVIGLAGHGKSSVVEAILGWPLLHVEFGNPARRPVRLSVQNNPLFTEPRFTLMSDPSLGMKKRVAFSDYRELRKELNLRLGQTKDLVKNPIHVLIEHAEALNFDITECPGLNPFNMSDAAVKLVQEIARPAHRQLIVVEECIEWDKVNNVLLQTALSLDPNFSRTIFVHTKLNTMLQGIYNAVDISRYFSGIVRTHSDTQAFWVTGLSQKCREVCVSEKQYRQRLTQARERDVNELSYLQADRRFHDFVGLTALRSHVLLLVVARVRACVPQIYFSLKSRQEEAERLCRTLADNLDGGLDLSHAKALGLNFVNQFVSFLENSVTGTLAVDPAVHGETALEEGVADWYDEDYELATSKLVGAQQFQRLQMEIRHHLSGLDFDVLLPVAEFPDPPGAIKPEDANRMAATMAHAGLVKSVGTMFHQACNRAEHILLHAFAVFDSAYAVSVTEKDDLSNQQRFVLAHSPYFRNLIRDKYKQFVAKHRETLEKELMEELLSSAALLWSLVSFPAVYAPPKTNTQGRVANTVQIHAAPVHTAPDTPKGGRIPAAADPGDRYKGLSNEARAELEKVQAEQKTRLMKPRAVGKRLFNVHRARMLGNISLKFYCHLMEPLVQDLGEYLGSCVLQLDKVEEVRQLFNFTTVTDSLYKKKHEMDRVVDFLRDSTATYQRASTLFLTLVKPLEH